MKITRQIVGAEPLAAVVEEEMTPGARCTGDDALLEAARQHSQTIYHPVGTCKMGPGPAAVVAEKLRAHGLEGLRIVDASIMPTPPSGKHHAQATMIEEQAPELTVEEIGRAAGRDKMGQD